MKYLKMIFEEIYTPLTEQKCIMGMKQIYYTLSIFVFLLLTISSVTAATGPQITGYKSGIEKASKSYRYHTNVLNGNFQPAKKTESRIIEINYDIYFDYVFKWKLSILMGEPVVIGWVAYKPTSVISFNMPNGINQEKLLEKIRISEFKMEVDMFLKPSGQRAFDKGATLVIDAGSASTPYLGYSTGDLLENRKLFSDFSSFNVPGSPNWDKLFTNIDNKQQAKKYFIDLTSAARKRDRYYASYYKHKIFKIKIDTSAIDKHIHKYLKGLEKEIWEQQNKKNEKAKSRQTDELEAALAETAGSTEGGHSGSLDEMFDEVEQYHKEMEEKRKEKFVAGRGKVTDRAVEITVLDNNSVQDDYYKLYVNDEYLGDVNNRPGGSTSYKTMLNSGKNSIELVLDKKMGKGTKLLISIEPGNYSSEFNDSHNHIFIINAP